MDLHNMELHNMREEDTSAYLNITSLCGPGGWQVLESYSHGKPSKHHILSFGTLWSSAIQAWDTEKKDFGRCFQDVVIILPAQTLLAVVSAYYLGFQVTLHCQQNSTTPINYILVFRPASGTCGQVCKSNFDYDDKDY